MKKPFSFRLTPELIDAARRQAFQENRTLTNWIETVIRRALKMKTKN